jgi:transcriptional regulator with XRE-family HTH domain
MEKFKIKYTTVIEEEVSFNKYMALKIRELRKQRGITQEEFANRIGLTRASVVNIEKGRQILTMKNLYLICSFFQIKSSELIPF